ncbi:hypothetical protein E2C01_059743 [Portunus trituberculatus]|uniref:Uncharacterized protein n=1 Tax=Portunus trituberculatus TaxID=210409 RepID=A0A5B7H7H4_PORTR|nr:hypothetical protein [Portunus trituberculatus]
MVVVAMSCAAEAVKYARRAVIYTSNSEPQTGSEFARLKILPATGTCALEVVAPNPTRITNLQQEYSSSYECIILADR